MSLQRQRYAGVDVLERRPGAALPVVLLHGVGGRAESFRPLMNLWPEGPLLLAWDMPGYGRSDGFPILPARLDHYATALAAMLNVAGIESCHLVGQSLGALIATRFCVRAPARVKTLSLLSPAHGYATSDGLTDALAARMRDFHVEGAERFAAKRAPRLVANPDSNPQSVAAVAAQMATLTPHGHLQAVHALSVGSIAADLAGIRTPLLFVSGDADLVTPLAGTQALAARFAAPCRVIADAGHAAYLEQTAAVLAALTSFQEAS